MGNENKEKTIENKFNSIIANKDYEKYLTEENIKTFNKHTKKENKEILTTL